MTARFVVADVFDGLAQLEDGSVDLVVTSPPFLALRSYLPADHPDKDKEIGSEATPAEFLDTLLVVTAELRRVLAPHGSIAIELGDTYAGSGGAGGDYGEGGWRGDQAKFAGSELKHRKSKVLVDGKRLQQGEGWPLAKSKTLIPEMFRLALAYGINPLTGAESPAGRWRVRNVVTWCRPNPPVGALGDKWRPATSDVVVACVSDRRYWDDIATRKPLAEKTLTVSNGLQPSAKNQDSPTASHRMERLNDENRGAPLLDWWELTASGYPGSHYAVFPPALVEPLVKAMAPPKVCRTCGEPSRRIVETSYDGATWPSGGQKNGLARQPERADLPYSGETKGWSDCGHNDWRPSLILDPFGGSGTVGQVATGHGHDCILIDLDERNRDLAYERIGGFLWEHEATEGVSGGR